MNSTLAQDNVYIIIKWKSTNALYSKLFIFINKQEGNIILKSVHHNDCFTNLFTD